MKADEFDVGWDFDSLQKAGTMAGSGAIVVMDDSRSMVEMAMRTARFYAHESCGQCVPCREGTKWVYTIMKRLLAGKATKADIDKAHEICMNIEGKTICVLTEAISWPIRSFLRKFREEFDALAVPESSVTSELPKVSGEFGGLLPLVSNAGTFQIKSGEYRGVEPYPRIQAPSSEEVHEYKSKISFHVN